MNNYWYYTQKYNLNWKLFNCFVRIVFFECFNCSKKANQTVDLRKRFFKDVKHAEDIECLKFLFVPTYCSIKFKTGQPNEKINCSRKNSSVCRTKQEWILRFHSKEFCWPNCYKIMKFRYFFHLIIWWKSNLYGGKIIFYLKSSINFPSIAKFLHDLKISAQMSSSFNNWYNFLIDYL